METPQQATIPNLERRSAGILTTKRLPVEWPPASSFRILSIDGGGIRGILPATILSEFEQKHLNGQPIGKYFDLIAGTSTGGIIALGLAAGLSATEILDIYMTKGQEIFPPRCAAIRWINERKRFWGTKLDTEVLYKVIDDIFKDKKIWEVKNRLCIPSMEGTFGEVFVYKTPHHPDYKKDWLQNCSTAAKATSAAPTYFKSFSNSGYLMADGGVWANNPVMIAVTEALTAFDVSRDRVKVLSLGCVQSEYFLTKKKAGGGKLHWRDIFEGSMHLTSQNALGQAGLLVGRQNLLRIDSKPLEKSIDLDDWLRSKDILPPIGQKLAEQYKDQVLNMFLGEVAAEFKPIYTPLSPPA